MIFVKVYYTHRRTSFSSSIIFHTELHAPVIIVFFKILHVIPAMHSTLMAQAQFYIDGKKFSSVCIRK